MIKSEQDKAVKTAEVFVREECIFKYCPNPERCKDRCQAPRLREGSEEPHPAIEMPVTKEAKPWANKSCCEAAPTTRILPNPCVYGGSGKAEELENAEGK